MFDVSILIEPFMLRALTAGAIVSGMTAIVGVYAITRNAAFFANAIAHAALLGIALGLLLGLSPLITAFATAMCIALLLPVLETKTDLHTDTLLGLMMPISMAVAVLVLSFIPGYKPELVSFLFGNILAISWQSIIISAVLNGVAILLIIKMYKSLTSIAIDPTFAKVVGINAVMITTLHNMLLTTAIIPSVSMVGIILVSALVVIPAAIASQTATSFKELLRKSIIISELTTISSIVVSALANIPTGPTIVVGLGLVFLAYVLKPSVNIKSMNLSFTQK